MPRSASFDRRLLGGLSPDEFLAEYWQKKPLLVRGAIPRMTPILDAPALFELAARDDVESRLVSVTRGRWRLRYGPFATMPMRRRAWTLLVQGVNLHHHGADTLMRRFDFVSAMRLDDLMVSHAVDDGGVGAHVDSYDVFLLQASGRRRWRWSAQDDLDLVEGAPLAQLKNFRPTEEAVLEPGDMLYLPPHIAHEGAAVGVCTTYSIGFRAPAWNELAHEFLFGLAERDWFEGRYADPRRRATRSPAELDPGFVDEVAARLARIRWTRSDVADFLGRHFSEPKATVFHDRPPAMSLRRFLVRAAREGLALSPKTIMLYRGRKVFIAGELHTPPPTTLAASRLLANRRRLDPAAIAALLRDEACATLLYLWWQSGWVEFGKEERDAHV